jgi:cadmium resistance protein CadD (predicted permease)
VVTACIGAAFAANFAPQRWVGYLGLVPIALGVHELYRLYAPNSREPTGPEPNAPPIPALGVAGVMLANSADSLSALVPLFAETRDALLPLIALVVLAASAIGCWLARWISSHERLGPLIRRMAPRLVPFVLIGVGLYVLSDTGTDTLR